MKKKLLSIVLALCMVLTLLPVTAAFAAEGNATLVIVGGVELNEATPYWKNGEDTASNSAAGHNAYFDAATATLTLKDAVIGGATLVGGQNYGVKANGIIAIQLEGNSTVAADAMNTWGDTNYSVYSSSGDGRDATGGGITICGEGSLTVSCGQSSGGSFGIYCGGDVTISGGATVSTTGGYVPYNGAYQDSYGLHAKGTVSIENGATVSTTGSRGSGSFGIQAAAVVISGGTVTAVGGESASGYSEGISSNSITVSGGSVTASGSNKSMTSAPVLSGYTPGYKWRTADDGDYTASINTAYTWNSEHTYVEIALPKWTDEGCRDADFFEEYYDDGYNEYYIDTGIEISTAAELGKFAYLMNEGNTYLDNITITLTGDIDLAGALWVPIAAAYDFTFDGQGYTIKNMRVKGAVEVYDTYYAGLFAILGEGSTVKNLNITGEINVRGMDDATYVGGLVGNASRYFNEQSIHIENVHTDVAINVSDADFTYAGGVCGSFINDPDTILNCSAVGDISITGTGDKVVGGLVGYMLGSSLRNSYYSGNIAADAAEASYYDEYYIGGLVGLSSAGYDENVIDNCYAAGEGWSVLVGESNSDALTNCRNNVTTADVGDALTALNGNLMSGYYEWEIKTGVNGGLPIHKAPTYWRNNKENIDTSGEVVAISSGGQLAALEGVNLAGKTVRLMRDIDLSAHYWTPINLIGGGNTAAGFITFDGNGKTISGMKVVESVDSGGVVIINHTVIPNFSDYIQRDDAHAGAAGLFGSLKYAHVKDLILASPSVDVVSPDITTGFISDPEESYYRESRFDTVGALAGYISYTRLENCHVTEPTVTARNTMDAELQGNTGFTYGQFAGGMVGYGAKRAMLTECTVTGGGVSLLREGDGTNPAEQVYCGGVIGYLYCGLLLNCGATSDVHAAWLGDAEYAGVYLGGLAGIVSVTWEAYGYTARDSSCVINCYARGRVSSDILASEYNHSNSLCTGGLAGCLDDTALNNYAAGAVEYVDGPGGDDNVEYNLYTGALYGFVNYPIDLDNDDTPVYDMAGNYYDTGMTGALPAYGDYEMAYYCDQPPEEAFIAMAEDGDYKEQLLLALNAGVEGARSVGSDHLAARQSETPEIGEMLLVVGPLKIRDWTIINGVNDGYPVHEAPPAPPTSIITPNTGNVPVIVDGVSHDLGELSVEGDTATVTVDQDGLNAQLESARESVLVPVNAETDTAAVQLVLQNVEDMAERDMTLIIRSGGVDYSIPASAIDAAAVMEALGAENSADVPFTVTVTLTGETPFIEGAALVIPAVSFTVTATYGGQTVEIEVFESFAARTVEVTEEEYDQITTAAVCEPDGSVRHVPTEKFQKDGKWYVRAYSLTNSTYVFIHSERGFADAKGKWYEDVVNEMASRGIIEGRGDGVFDGGAYITRAEFAAILVRALGLPETGDASAFTDVEKTAWYYGAVGKAFEYGLIEGRGDGIFAPTEFITRQDAMLVIQRAAKIAQHVSVKNEYEDFSDLETVSGYAKEAMLWNLENGFVVGYKGLVRPRDNISRGESAAIVLRLLQESGLVDMRTEA